MTPCLFVFKQRDKKKLVELFPLKVYPFTAISLKAVVLTLVCQMNLEL